jgi:hypothetical protein
MVGRAAPLGMCPACLAAHRAGERAQAVLGAIPERHEAVAFGAPELTEWCRDEEAIRRAQAFAQAAPRGCRVLLLTGPTESGKSSLAAAIVQHLRAGPRRGARVAWALARTMAMSRRAHPLGETPPIIARMLRADIAVFDDVGKELVLPADQAIEVVEALEVRHAADPGTVPAGALSIVTTELPVTLPKRSDSIAGAVVPVRDLASLYDLSFVRRIAGKWTGGDVPRGSAVVIEVRRNR